MMALLNILYEKNPGDAQDVPRDPWDPRDPLGTPLGALGTPLGPPGTPLGPPGDVPETPWERPWAPPGTLQGLPATPMDHQDGHISTNIQRQKLSIAVCEAAHEGPSHEALDRTVFSIKSPPK